MQFKQILFHFVDHAVKSLCNIWHPQDIPVALMTLTHPTVLVGRYSEPLISSPSNQSASQTHYHNNQLPLPISPSTWSFPPVSPPIFTSAHALGTKAMPLTQPNTNLVPIKGFMHEALCRSRTSCSTLLPGCHLHQGPRACREGE